MKKLIILFLVIGIIAIGGCTQQNVSPSGTDSSNENTANVQANQIVSLFISSSLVENWDSDPEVDGIEISLSPRDESENLVKTDGIMSAKLWTIGYSPSTGKSEKKDFIKEWNSISFKKEDFDFFGAKVKLEYDSTFKPKSSDMGWLEVTLTTPDGKTFTAVEKSIFLAGI